MLADVLALPTVVPRAVHVSVPALLTAVNPFDDEASVYVLLYVAVPDAGALVPTLPLE